MIGIIEKYQDEFPNHENDLSEVFNKLNKTTDEIAYLVRSKNLEALVASDYDNVLIYSEFLKDIGSYQDRLNDLSNRTPHS